MRHLFIINPRASRVRNRVDEIAGGIRSFFGDMGMDNYDIHVTRWARDGMGIANRYALAASGPVRIHAMGGTGTLYEAVNGTIGLPNAQIATYPLGNSNFCVQYLGESREHLFRSLRNQVFSDTVPIDVMRCKNIYGIAHALIGLEAVSDRDGSALLQKTNLPGDLCRYYAAVNAILRGKDNALRYSVTIDGRGYGGEYVSMLIAGTPGYGTGMTPAPDARPDDGVMDIYMVKKMPLHKLLGVIAPYTSGRHENIGWAVRHVRGKSISVSSEETISVSIDGEAFCEREVSYEIVPGAVDLVCPDGIRLSKTAGAGGAPELSEGERP